MSMVDGVRASIVIQGSDSPIDKSGSPLAAKLAGHAVDDEAEQYVLALPHVEDVIRNTDKYEELWRDHWSRIETALDSFAKGASTVEEFTDVDLSLVTLARDIFGPNGFDPARDAAPHPRLGHGQSPLRILRVGFAITSRAIAYRPIVGDRVAADRAFHASIVGRRWH